MSSPTSDRIPLYNAFTWASVSGGMSASRASSLAIRS
jgi:hypothetical protein